MARRPIWEALERLVEDLEDDRREFLYMKPTKQGAIDPEFLPFSQEQLRKADPTQLWHYKNVLKNELRTAQGQDKERIELAIKVLDRAGYKPDLSGKTDEPGGGMSPAPGLKGGFQSSQDKFDKPSKARTNPYSAAPDTKWSKPANTSSMRVFNDEVRAYVDAMRDMNTKSQFQDALKKFERTGATMEQWAKLLELAKAQVDHQHQRDRTPKEKPQTVPGSTAYKSNKPGSYQANYPGMYSGYRRPR